MATKKKMLQAAAGNAGGAGLNVEEVFSTYLYTGGTAQEINNGIDLDTEGGMVWIKRRETSGYDHQVFDTERTSGTYSTPLRLSPNLTNPEDVYFTTGEFSWLTDGFDLNNADANVNGSGGDYASWTFRKAPRFFDVVTYTGSDSTQTINHSLASEVGFMVVKRVSSGTGQWYAHHRSLTSGHIIKLNSTDASTSNASSLLYNVTSTSFTVDAGAYHTNAAGETYVAYLFAHNNNDGEFGPNGDADIIKCGSYTGTGAAGNFVDLGFEPQWLLLKRTDSTEDWPLVDSMRGFVAGGNVDRLRANSDSEEISATNRVEPNSTGFTLKSSSNEYNGSGGTYIYIAIRRGTAVPESATDVFAVTTQSGSTPPAHDTGFVTDFSLRRENPLSSASVIQVADRLRGKPYLTTEGTNSETNLNNNTWDFMDGWFGATSNDSNKYAWSWKRAPKYFDVVAYTGNGTNGRAISHNLGVAPEMIWIKNRDDSTDWAVRVPNALSSYKELKLNDSSAANFWNYIQGQSETTFTVGNNGSVNHSSGNTYIAYLFASLDGISKVGSYTGTGATLNIDCGFTSGARFVLLKRTDSAQGWQVFDTARGIVAGNDPILELNTTAPEEAFDDLIDPYSAGFSLTSSGMVNVSGGTYIFYAIA
jgi:hypothetical protein